MFLARLFVPIPDFGYLITCIILQLDNSLHSSTAHFPLVYRSAIFFLLVSLFLYPQSITNIVTVLSAIHSQV